MNGHSETSRGGVALYFLIAFGWSWGAALFAHLNAAVSWGVGLGVVYMAGPSLGAVVCALIFDRGRFFRAVGLASNPFNIWLLWAFLAPILIAAAAFALTLLFGDRAFAPPAEAFADMMRASGQDPDELPMPIEQFALIQIVSAPFIAAVANTIVLILTEELGWRGWLYDRWSRFGFWKNALLTGLVWGVWHAPVIALFGHNYPAAPVAGPLLFIAWCILFSPLMALLRERGGSVVHAAMVHGVLNGLAPITLLLLRDASMPWRGILGVGGFIALAIMLALIMPLRKKRTA